MINAVLLAILTLVPAFARADSNGMDMSMDGPMDLTIGKMLPYIHFTSGDMLWFLGWVPTSVGAMVGACIGLFLLAIIDRWIAACRSLMEAHWRKRALMLISNRINTARPSSIASTDSADAAPEKGRATSASLPVVRTAAAPTLRQGLRNTAPFVPAHDITRGVMHAVQAALGFAFMLAAMTFQGAFILSICLGLGVGEALFGRYHAQAHLH